MIVRQTGASVVFKNILPEKRPTFRNLIHTYLDKSNQSWSKFGIDMCLGSNLDDQVTNDQSMFLPDYLMKGIDNATGRRSPIVSANANRCCCTACSPGCELRSTPMFFILHAVCYYRAAYRSVLTNGLQRFLNVFDCIFFLFVGLFGLLIVTLWVIRVDTVCRNNFIYFGRCLPISL